MRRALYLAGMRACNRVECPLGCKHEPRPTAARLSSGSLADCLARKELADFLLEAIARFFRRRFRVICE